MRPAHRLTRRFRRSTDPQKEPHRQASAPAPPPAPAESGGPTPREALMLGIARGASFEQAVIWQVRSLLDADLPDEAWAIALSLRSHPHTEAIGRTAAGIVAYRRGFERLAREAMRGVPAVMWANLAARAYVRAGLAVEPAETLDEVRALAAADPDYMKVRSWLDILTAVFGHGDHALARAIFEVFERRLEREPDEWPEGTRYLDSMRPWVAAGGEVRTAPPPSGGLRSFAIMDYGHPGADQAPANIGDHIQTLASLGHLARHRGVRWHGSGELVSLLGEVGDGIRPELRLDDVDADVELVTVHRDASTFDAIAEDTWVLCFGWYMHALFRMRHVFPPHPNLRPIFVSFHTATRGLLTPEAIEYLRRYGPVGCRDWNTVDLLLSLDVPAFFSGCLTTTTAAALPDLPEPPDDAPVAYVDVAAPDGGTHYTHISDDIRVRPFAANMRAAIALLESYRSRHRSIITSRLHCYLPARSLGIDVDFRPPNRADNRFEGLIDLDEADFRATGGHLTAILEPVLRAILSGRPEDEVYGLWRELTAADVAAANERHRRDAALPEPPAEAEAQIEQAVAGTVTRERTAAAPPGDTVHVAAIANVRGLSRLSVLTESLLEHASRPVHLWVLLLPGDADAVDRELGGRFPQLTYSTVPLRGVGAGLVTPAGEEQRPATVARLLTAELLPAVDRVALLPLPTIVEGDVAELAELELGRHSVAAATESSVDRLSGFGVIDDAALRLGDRTGVASELRRTAHARHRFDFDAFEHSMLVLDLAQLRAERFAEAALRVVQAYGLDDREALHYLLGPNRVPIPDAWHVIPSRMEVEAPKLVHWADAIKPWRGMLSPERDRWRRYAGEAS